MSLHPYKPVPWETFTLIPTRRAHRRAMTMRAFLILVALAMLAGALFAFNH